MRWPIFMTTPLTRLSALTSALLCALLLGACVQKPDPTLPKIDDVLARMNAACNSAQTMSADFRYTVESDVRHQEVIGHMQLMKPNYARLTFTRIAEPAFPNLIGSDGRFTYTYVPKNFRGGRLPTTLPLNPEYRTTEDPALRVNDEDANAAPTRHDAALGGIITNRTFAPGDHDPLLAARQASGLVKGGIIEKSRTDTRGRNLLLWDSIAIRSFFDVMSGLRALYFSSTSELKVEGMQTINGVTYTVIYHRYTGGNIEGGAASDFDQRVFVGPDNLIHRYELRFTSNGKPGLQIMELTKVRLNQPMKAEDFVFTPPL